MQTISLPIAAIISTLIMGFGRTSVSSASLVSNPLAKITTFTFNYDFCLVNNCHTKIV